MSDAPIKRLEMWRDGKLPDESGIAYCAGNKLFADDVMALMRDLAAANAENAKLRESIGEQTAVIEALMAGSMVASDEGVIPVIRRIGALQEQLSLAHDAINDALPWMIKLGDYIGNGTQADPMGRCNAILKMRIAVEKRDD